MNSIGDRIKYIRNLKKLTINEVVTLTGLNKASVSQYENNKYDPSSQAVVKLCKLFEINYEWLLEGTGSVFAHTESDKRKRFLAITEDSEREYHNSVLQLDYAMTGERFKQARELSGRTLDQAAASAYLKPEVLQRIEDVSEFNTKDIGMEQIACLAYLYDVDLYWLFSGKTRPPAAILKDGAKAYPPYEFMLEQTPAPVTAGSTTTAAANVKLNEDEQELLETFSYLNTEGRKETLDFIRYFLHRYQNLSSSSSLNHDIKKDKLA